MSIKWFEFDFKIIAIFLKEKMDTFMKSAKLKSGISEQNKKQLLASSKAIDAELAKHSRGT